MNPIDALYHTVHNSPGGADALAPRLGITRGTLCHLVKPPAGGFAKMGLTQAMQIMDMTGDLTALDAMELHFGRMAVPLPVLAIEGDDVLMAHVARAASEFGEVMTEVCTVAADGTITDNELARVHKAWGELQAAGKMMMGHLAALNAKGKPSVAISLTVPKRVA